jgi:phytoene dehydrogenase-like protein
MGWSFELATFSSSFRRSLARRAVRDYNRLVNEPTLIRTRYDAVVVGSGHNGLVAAAYLARAGQSVLVLERNPSLGGATASHAIFPAFDARLSRYSYLVSLLPDKIVEDLGLRFTTRRRAVASCTPYERDRTPSALLLSNVDDALSQASFEARAGAADWKGYQAFLELEQALARHYWPSLLQPLRSRSAWRGSLDLPVEREAWDAFVENPLGEALEGYVRDDLVRGLIFTDAMIGILTHPDDPSLQQNRCFLLHVSGQGTGEWRVPVGGMGALVAELTARGREAGVTYVTDAEVTQVHPGSPANAVVYRDPSGSERRVDATRVLINAAPSVFDRLLGNAHEERSADEGSVCKVNLLLRRLPRLRADVAPSDAFRGTFHVDESYEGMKQSYREATNGRIPEHPPIDVYCHSLTDDSILGPDLRRAGYHTLTMFGLDVPYRLFLADNAGTKSRVLERYLRGINRQLAEPIEECVARDPEGQLCLEIKSPIDLERELAMDRGHIFHGALSWFFAESDEQIGTWGVETTYPRVYRCGSSARRGGAVSGIPGFCVARRIFDELRVLAG